MPTSAGAPIQEYFATVTDPRVERTKLHLLMDILVMAICAVICGADSWVEMEAYGRAKEQWLRQFLALPNGIPSHDTFARVLVDCSVSFGTNCGALLFCPGVQVPARPGPVKGMRKAAIVLRPTGIEVIDQLLP